MFFSHIFCKFLLIFLLSTKNLQINSQINTITNYQQDFGNCNCDLTELICNLNCCCDPDCSSADLRAFKCQNNPYYNYYSKFWCLPSASLFIQNTPYIVNSFTDLVCVDSNNSLKLNYYLPPLINNVALKESYVNQLVNIAVPQTNEVSAPYSIKPPPLISQNTGTISTEDPKYFINTDPVWVFFKNNAFGYLTLPIQIGSNCRSGPPLNYFEQKVSYCYATPNQIKNECNSAAALTPLSLSSFLGNFKIVMKPNSLSLCKKSPSTTTSSTSTVTTTTTTTANPLGFDYYTLCDSYLATIKIRKCILGSGSDCGIINNDYSSFLKPSIDGTGTCRNLVKHVTYLLRYQNPGGILEAGIDIEFFDSDLSGTTNVEQKFETAYVPSSESIDGFVFNETLSGNPGYQINRPILAGNVVNGQLNYLSADVNKRFTYLSAQPLNGNCPSDDSYRKPVQFLVNSASECNYLANLDLSVTGCQSLQNQIYNISLGRASEQISNYYAPFANSEVKNWQRILNVVPTSYPSFVNGVCKALTTGNTIQIAYALLGKIENPQAELVYISYNWDQTQDIGLRCIDQFCTNYANYPIKLSTRVVFVDVTQSPLYTESQIKRPTTTLPGDFFFPLTSSSQKLHDKIKSSIFIVFILCLKF